MEATLWTVQYLSCKPKREVMGILKTRWQSSKRLLIILSGFPGNNNLLSCCQFNTYCNPVSVGYTSQDISYNWTTGRGVNIASDMKLSQFDLIATPTGNETTERSKGTYSTLLVSFHLQRHMGDFVIQVQQLDIYYWCWGLMFRFMGRVSYWSSYLGYRSGSTERQPLTGSH